MGMYDQVYTYPDDDNNKKEDKNEKQDIGFKDIIAMVIAAYQVVFVPFSIVVLGIVALFLLLKIFLGG